MFQFLLFASVDFLANQKTGTYPTQPGPSESMHESNELGSSNCSILIIIRWGGGGGRERDRQTDRDRQTERKRDERMSKLCYECF